MGPEVGPDRVVSGAADGPLRVASLQMEPRVGDPDGNLARSTALIRTAAAGGARLLVLPDYHPL